MTDLVKQYIELGKNWYADLSDEEDERRSKENEKIKSQMTVAELESLKSYISAREFSLAIKPLIEAKQRSK